MLIKNNDCVWITCSKCGGHIRSDRGGKCNCDNIVVTVHPNGAAEVEADDSDEVVYENER